LDAARLLGGRLRIEDYRSLLLNLRQQVLEGSRAASNFGPAHEPLRSLYLRHAVAEHRDYRLIEEDYATVGGRHDDIRAAPKNIGSEALSAFMYHAASRPDPIGTLGAMFIIEGLGARIAGDWAVAIRAQLGLGDEAVRFLTHHASNDRDHVDALDQALEIAATDEAAADDILRHARVAARLYRLQLEELDNV
jgi:hypothetical protein